MPKTVSMSYNQATELQPGVRIKVIRTNGAFDETVEKVDVFPTHVEVVTDRCAKPHAIPFSAKVMGAADESLRGECVTVWKDIERRKASKQYVLPLIPPKGVVRLVMLQSKKDFGDYKLAFCVDTELYTVPITEEKFNCLKKAGLCVEEPEVFEDED